MAGELAAKPNTRKLRIFSFDPAVASRHDTAQLSFLTLSIPWEELESGPVGEYIEVVDVDPASGVVYVPVDLDNPRLLAQDGHAPSETNPQFHQQMVYAVAMATIGHFQQALGRVALWSDHRFHAKSGDRSSNDGYKRMFVRRLRIYPHALRDQNAYYSPVKKALLFGYFPVARKDKDNVPGTLVFTALSHDIIAHETAHALLDGVHPRFDKAFNPDVLAFHEAFADIVALFQHFSYPGLLRDQMTRTRGNLESENMLGQLAQQFGSAAGRGDALREALGRKNDDGLWELTKPDVRALDKTDEPHDRGAILVTAIFGAFVTVYKSRTRDLYRIASEGTGILRDGEIHPDLVLRLADEAARCAAYMLQMCIRAIDYAPPVGITFGDYLRAMVTSDMDLNPEDPFGYRLAVVESFRKWGIQPRDMRSMSVESLQWPSVEDILREEATAGPVASADSKGTMPATAKAAMDSIKGKYASAYATDSWVTGVGNENVRSLFKEKAPKPATSDDVDRLRIWYHARDQAEKFHRWLLAGESDVLLRAIGIIHDPASSEHGLKRTVFGQRRKNGKVLYNVEIHSVRSASRRGRQGWNLPEIVVEITQRRRGYFDPELQKRKDSGDEQIGKDEFGDFRFYAGCTLLINPATMAFRRVIRTHGTIDDDKALDRVRRFLNGERLDADNAFEPARRAIARGEPFAMLHRGGH